MLLNRSTTLPSGLRVRLRLPLAADRVALRALHERAGREIDELELARLTRHDPRRRAALCATAWTAEGHVLAGFAAGDCGAHGPDVLVVDPRAGADLAALLTAALAERTGAARRPSVA
jgi:hypothetical protein